MSTQRLWATAIGAALLAIALVQAHDALVWARGPWLGVTLGADGRLSARGEPDTPEALAQLLADWSLFAVAVSTDAASTDQMAGWTALTEPRDSPAYKSWNHTRVAYARLRLALADTTIGDPVQLRVRDATGAEHEVSLRVGRVPVRIALERVLLYHGLGLMVVVFGGFVLRARPRSGRALAFALVALTLGGQLLTTQVLGGFPSRFYWLSLVECRWL